MNVLILRFEAPLMSFGTVAVDKWRPSGPFPALSAVTGLLGAALGYKRYQSGDLQRLEDRLRLASRVDRRGQLLTDYQTVDIGEPWMNGSARGVGWTTRHKIETRGGASPGSGTLIRHRTYWADVVTTLAITLQPAAENPTVAETAQALWRPHYPLFLGRKSCPPAAPILLEQSDAQSLYEALEAVPAHDHADGDSLPAQWPIEEIGGLQEEVLRDRRDWANQVHAGSRRAWRGTVTPRIAKESVDE